MRIFRAGFFAGYSVSLPAAGFRALAAVVGGDEVIQTSGVGDAQLAAAFSGIG